MHWRACIVSHAAVYDTMILFVHANTFCHTAEKSCTK